MGNSCKIGIEHTPSRHVVFRQDQLLPAKLGAILPFLSIESASKFSNRVYKFTQTRDENYKHEVALFNDSKK